MGLIWKMISQQGWNKIKTQKVFLICSVLAFCFVGALVWLLIGRILMPSVGGLFCFVGYFGFFVGFIGGFIYLCQQI